MDFLKKNKLAILAACLTLLIILLASFIFISLSQINNTIESPTGTKSPNANVNTPSQIDIYPLSTPLNNQDEVKNNASMKKFIHPSGLFEYSYPISWEFMKNREGIGLVPTEVLNKTEWNGEIVTIFTLQTDQGLIEWSQGYNGINNKIDEETIINGYQTYHIYKESNELTMHLYTFKKDNNIVQINFRQKSGTNDFTSYLSDFENILESFKFI